MYPRQVFFVAKFHLLLNHSDIRCIYSVLMSATVQKLQQCKYSPLPRCLLIRRPNSFAGPRANADNLCAQDG